MSLSRFAPHLGQAIRAIIEYPKAFLLIAAPWLLLLLLSRSLEPMLGLGAAQSGLLSLGLDCIALGGLGVNWQRFLYASAQDPTAKPSFGFGIRHLLWGAVAQIFSYFESVPALFVSMMMGDDPNALAISLAVKQLFQLLIGGMLLMLPHIALKVTGDKTTPLQAMVLKGGVAVGLGYVLTQLPFVFLAQSLIGFQESGDLPSAILTIGYALMALLNTSIMAGYYALVWRELR
jgi:hypothetical protein